MPCSKSLTPTAATWRKPFAKPTCLYPAPMFAQRMRRDKAQITRVLNDLLDSGLILKACNPADKRSQILHPTSAGEAMMQRIQGLEQQTLTRMTRDLTQEEVEHFIRIAWHMTQNLEGDLPPDN